MSEEHFGKKEAKQIQRKSFSQKEREGKNIQEKYLVLSKEYFVFWKYVRRETIRRNGRKENGLIPGSWEEAHLDRIEKCTTVMTSEKERRVSRFEKAGQQNLIKNHDGITL